jgi:FkbM family methyltransferase
MYVREARTPRDFARLLRVRLSQSKIGRFVCPEPITVRVATRTLGRDVVLRSHTTDISVFGEILGGHAYQALVDAPSGEVKTVLDLGANTGLAARFLLNRFEHARLVAVEPDPGNVSVLQENLAPYGARALVVSACIGAYERRVALVGAREDAYSMRDDPGGDTEVVTMEGVVARLGNRHVDVLKVDIEGAERELFADSSSWIGDVGVASIECHHPITASELIDLIRRNGAEANVVRFEATPEFSCETVVIAVSIPAGT